MQILIFSRCAKWDHVLLQRSGSRENLISKHESIKVLIRRCMSFKLLPPCEKTLFWKKKIKFIDCFNSRWSIPEVEVCFPISSKLNVPIFHLEITFHFHFCTAQILFLKSQNRNKVFCFLVGAGEEIFCVGTERIFEYLNALSLPPSDFPKSTSKCGKTRNPGEIAAYKEQLSVKVRSPCSRTARARIFHCWDRKSVFKQQ